MPRTASRRRGSARGACRRGWAIGRCRARPYDAPVTHPLWPLFDLRLATGDLELRIPREDELPAFAEVVERGIHPPDEMPFGIAWTDLPTAERNLESYRWWMSARADFATGALDAHARASGSAAGRSASRTSGPRSSVSPARSPPARGSGRSSRAAGSGALMRQAVLALAFDHLGAEVAETEAFLDNPASNRVSLGDRLRAERLRPARAAGRRSRDAAVPPHRWRAGARGRARR